MTERFSDRQGYRPSAVQITVREDAPPELRSAIHLIAEDLNMAPSDMRHVICRVLLVKPDPDNWSEYPNIYYEVEQLIASAQWYEVYDIIEVLYAEFAREAFLQDFSPADKFEQRLNDFFVEKGIGWELRDGKITHRGSKAFAKSTQEVPDHLNGSGFPRAANEMSEALIDISRRPEPDITGAIQHAIVALEATAREVTGQPNQTLGKLVPKLGLPKPLDQAVQKFWGYTSEYARHIREQQVVDPAEAELVVTVAGALCEFLTQRRS